MNISKNQHTIPQFYLRNFSPDDDRENKAKRVWIYNKLDNFISTRFQKIKETGCENNFYSFKENEKNNDFLEKELSKIEDKASSVLGKIISGKIISKQERIYFSDFLSLTKLRTRTSRRQLCEIEANTARNDLYKFFLNKPLEAKKILIEYGCNEDDYNKLSKIVLENELENFHFQIPKVLTFRILKYYQELSTIINEMNWKLLESPDNRFFITGDHPVTHIVATPQDGIGITNETAKVFFPLSPNLCWYASWKSHSFSEIKKISLKAEYLKNMGVLRIR